MEQESLKPCPFCGKTDSDDNACVESPITPHTLRGPNGALFTRVWCACGASGAGKEDYIEALAAWNRRV